MKDGKGGLFQAEKQYCKGHVVGGTMLYPGTESTVRVG